MYSIEYDIDIERVHLCISCTYGCKVLDPSWDLRQRLHISEDYRVHMHEQPQRHLLQLPRLLL
jgi:hypothetical protein